MADSREDRLSFLRTLREMAYRMPTGEKRDRRDEIVDEFARLFNEADELGMESYPSSDSADPEIIFSWDGHDVSVILGPDNKWVRRTV